MLHLETIIARPTEFTESTRDKAELLKNYFLSSTAMLLINFNLDVMQEFSRQSLIFQINDQSSKDRKSCFLKLKSWLLFLVIGQAKSREALLDSLNKVKGISGGAKTKAFLLVSLITYFIRQHLHYIYFCLDDCRKLSATNLKLIWIETETVMFVPSNVQLLPSSNPQNTLLTKDYNSKQTVNCLNCPHSRQDTSPNLLKRLESYSQKNMKGDL